MFKVKNNADSAEMYIYGDIIDDLDMDPMAGLSGLLISKDSSTNARVNL